MIVTKYNVAVHGNDGYENSRTVNVPASWSEAERYVAAIRTTIASFEKLTIEKFTRVEAYELQTFEGKADV